MKPINRTLLSLIVGAATLASCNKFDDLSTNPDAATKAAAPMLVTKPILGITQQGTVKNFVHYSMLNKQIVWSGNASGKQYNLPGRTDFDGYTILTNCQKIIDTTGDGGKDPYVASAKFMKAYKLFYKSLEVGNIPCSDTLKGEEGAQKFRYDTQREAMRQASENLEEVYTLFPPGDDFDGDPIFGGDTENWRKTVVVFELRVLAHLCKKEVDANLKTREHFIRLTASGSLVTSNADNFQLIYFNKAGQLYPFYYTQNKYFDYLMVSNVIIDNPKRFNDYRMLYYVSPLKAQTDRRVKESEWDAYFSIDSPDNYSDISVLYGKGESCLANPYYIRIPEGKPLMHLNYAEQSLILAEGAVRGWISRDAPTYYKEGTEASMNFIADNTPDKEEYTHGCTIIQEYIQEYLAQPVIQLSGNKEKDLKMISLQCYLASFLQHPYDVYYDYHRIGYPVLPINPNMNLSTEKNKIPIRWIYPEVGFSYNPDNADEVVQRRYDGLDDASKLMWVLQ